MICVLPGSCRRKSCNDLRYRHSADVPLTSIGCTDAAPTAVCRALLTRIAMPTCTFCSSQVACLRLARTYHALLTGLPHSSRLHPHSSAAAGMRNSCLHQVHFARGHDRRGPLPAHPPWKVPARSPRCCGSGSALKNLSQMCSMSS